jgi:hypothetical protein
MFAAIETATLWKRSRKQLNLKMAKQWNHAIVTSKFFHQNTGLVYLVLTWTPVEKKSRYDKTAIRIPALRHAVGCSWEIFSNACKDCRMKPQQINPGVQESNPQNSETKQGIQKTPFTHSCNGDGAAIHTSTTCSIKPHDHWYHPAKHNILSCQRPVVKRRGEWFPCEFCKTSSRGCKTQCGIEQHRMQ